MEVKGNEDPYAEKSKAKQFARLKQTKNEIKNKIRSSQEATETMGVLKDKDKQRKPKKVPRAHRNAAEEKVKWLEILNDVLKKKPKLMSLCHDPDIFDVPKLTKCVDLSQTKGKKKGSHGVVCV